MRAWETHIASRALAEAGALQRDVAAVGHVHTSSVLRELGRAGMSGEGVSERERAGRPRAAFLGKARPLSHPISLSLLLPLTARRWRMRVCVYGGGKRVRAWETHQASRALAEAGALQRDVAAVPHVHTSSVLRKLGQQA